MQIKKILAAGLFCTGAVVAVPAVFAEVPVVDLTQQNSASLSSASSYSSAPTQPSQQSDNSASAALSTEQRVSIVERQISNINQLDLVGQINRVQQELAKIKGQLDEQSYQLKRLTEQVKAQYQDIDSRLSTQPVKPSSKQVLSSTGPITTLDSTKPAKPIIDPMQTSTSSVKTADNSVSAESGGDSSQEQGVYQSAIDLSKKGDYVRAVTAFQGYISKYPNGKFAANAHYWLGEIYLIQGQPDPAAMEFKTIINDFPSTSKVPEALLKLGQAYYDKGDYKHAKEEFLKVQKQFPKTPSASAATSKLQKMQQEGKSK